MKICIITSSFPMNAEDSSAAAGKACRDFALELEKTGHEVFLFAPKFSGKETSFGNLKIKRFSWGGSGKPLSMLKPSRPKDLLEIIRFLYCGRKQCLKFIRENQIKKVIAMWVVPGGLFGLFAKRKFGISYTVWALGADIWVYGRISFLKGIVKKVLTEAELIYADGVELCKDVESLSGKKSKFLPHLSNIQLDHCIPLTLHSNKTNFLFVGRWEQPKGIDVLIDAMILLSREEKDVHLYVIGGGSFEEQMKESIKKTSSGEFISLLGRLDQNIMVSYMKSCQALVIPSRIESIPCVYSEAMAAGIPVIVTDVGDMGLLTRTNKVGRVALPEDPLSLKNEMKLFLRDNQEEYRGNTIKVAEQWNLSAVVHKYVEDVQN